MSPAAWSRYLRRCDARRRAFEAAQLEVPEPQPGDLMSETQVLLSDYAARCSGCGKRLQVAHVPDLVTYCSPACIGAPWSERAGHPP